jgi:hypothetical protein
MEHTDMKIQQVVVMYLHDHQISRPPAPPIISRKSAEHLKNVFSLHFLNIYF